MARPQDLPPVRSATAGQAGIHTSQEPGMTDDKYYMWRNTSSKLYPLGSPWQARQRGADEDSQLPSPDPSRHPPPVRSHQKVLHRLA